MTAAPVQVRSLSTETVVFDNYAGTRSGRIIRLDQVSLTFGSRQSGLKALDDIDLSIREGGFIALVGPAGCGKSTILKLVSGLIGPTEPDDRHSRAAGSRPPLLQP